MAERDNINKFCPYTLHFNGYSYIIYCAISINRAFYGLAGPAPTTICQFSLEFAIVLQYSGANVQQMTF